MGYEDVGIRATILGLAEFRRGTNDMRNQLNQIGAAALGASSGAGSFGRSLTLLGSDISRVGQTMTYSLTLPIVALTGSLVAAGIQFEDAFAGVSKTVDGVSDNFGNLTADGQVLQDQFRDLALEIPISANELSRIGELGGQLGITKTELRDFVETVALLGVTTEMTSESAATFFARLGNIMGVSADQMAEFTKKAGSTVVDLGNKFAATEPEIAALSLRLAGAAQVAGLSTPQILALATAMASLGIQSEMGGSALSRVLLELKRTTDDYTATGGEATDQLKLFAQAAGLTVDAFVQLEKSDPLTALLKVIGGFNQMQESGTLTNDMLKEMNFDTIRLQDVLNRLGPNIGLVNQAVSTANKEWAQQDALQIEAQKRFNTTKSQLQLLKNAFVDLGIEIFYLYKDDINNLIKGFNSLIKTFKESGDQTLKTIVKVGLLVAAVGPLLVVLGTLVQLAGLASIGLAAIGGPIPLLIGLLGSLSVAFVLNFKDIRKTASKVVDTLSYITYWVKEAYKFGKNKPFGNVFTGIGQAFKALTYIFEDSETTFFSKLLQAFGMGEEGAKAFGMAIRDYLEPFLLNLYYGFNELGSAFGYFVDDIRSEGLLQAIKNLFTSVEGFQSPLEKIASAFGLSSDTIERFKLIITGLVNNVFPSLVAFAKEVWKAIKVLAGVFVSDIMPALIGFVGYLVDFVLPPVIDLATQFIKTAKAILEKAIPTFKTIVIPMLGFLAAAIVLVVIPAIKWLLEKIEEWSGILGPLTGALAALWLAVFILSPVFGVLNTAIKLLTTSMGFLTTGIGALILPIGIVILLLALYTNNTYGLRDAVDSAHQKLTIYVNILKELGRILSDGGIEKAIQNISNYVRNFSVPQAWQDWKNILSDVKNIVSGEKTGSLAPTSKLGTPYRVGTPLHLSPQMAMTFNPFSWGTSRDSGGRGLKGHPYKIGVPEIFMPDTNGTFTPYKDLVSLFEKGTTSSYTDDRNQQKVNVFSPTIYGAKIENEQSLEENLMRRYRMATMYS